MFVTRDATATRNSSLVAANTINSLIITTHTSSVTRRRVSAGDVSGLKEQNLTNQIVATFISDYRQIFDETTLGSRIGPQARLATKALSEPLHVDIPTTSEQVPLQVSPIVIPLVTISSEDVSQIKGRKQKRRLSGVGEPGTVPRSVSEERPSPEPPIGLDIRRCNSSEQVFVKVTTKARQTSLSEENLLDVSPQPSVAKRRHQLHDVGEGEVVSSPTPTWSESSQESTEARRLDERTSHVRHPPINRTMRMKALRECSKVALTSRTPSDESVELTSGEVAALSTTSSREPLLVTKMDSELSSENCSERGIESHAGDNVGSGTDQAAEPTSDLLTLASDAAVSEHRYSWPFLTPTTSKDSDDAPSSATYPLPHTALHQLRVAKCTTEAPTSPSAFRSFLHQRPGLSDPTNAPSPPVDQETFPDKRCLQEASSVKEIKHKIHVLKRKLKDFETEFELKNGYRPSHEQKMNSFIARPIMADLSRLRTQLKELREDLSFKEFDLLRAKMCGDFKDVDVEQTYMDATDEIDKALEICKTHGDRKLEEAIVNMQETLDARRSLKCRPSTVEDMTDEQILEEKLDLQKTLLKFESVFGRPENRHDREVMRPLYDRYRQVKRILSKMPTKPIKKDASDLQPILEHVVSSFEDKSNNQSRSDLVSLMALNISSSDISNCGRQGVQKDEGDTVNKELEDTSGQAEKNKSLAPNLHELPYKELLIQMEESKLEKQHLRVVIKKFEADFYKKVGRKVEHADRVHLEPVYRNYKVSSSRDVKVIAKVIVVLFARLTAHQRQIEAAGGAGGEETAAANVSVTDRHRI